MSKETLILLGGSHYLLPVIEAAHEHDLHVVTMDYLPNNVAHRYSDEYRNVSVTDHEAVLKAAKELNANGIMSFACDPGVVSAAYVAQKMALPFQCSYEAACTLQDKGMFRAFLSEHGFASPKSRRYTDAKAAVADADNLPWPVIVKPVDSAGSKGVTKLDGPEGLGRAIDLALNYSQCGAFIVEQFLTFTGFHSSADAFTVDGNLAFCTYSDQLFDKDADNPYTPVLIIWPSTMDARHQSELTSETQRLMRLLGMRNGIYNIETCVATDGTPYLMEVSPRGGGCKIAELQRLAYGIDLIDAEVRSAVGIPIEPIKTRECDGFWCEMVVHAEPGRSGLLKSVTIDPVVREKHLVVEDITALPGDMVEPFTGANMALGDLFLRFETREELNDIVSHASEWLRIDLA